MIQFARQGYKEISFDTYDTDWDSEAYLTVSGQNSNNSVRVTDAFLNAVESDQDWALNWRITDGVARTVKARDLWEQVGQAAWASADPGIQYHTTINDWHTCPASGEIRASNPCSEYMFLDDTACNLASMNLLTFLKDGVFDAEAYMHAGRVAPTPISGRWGRISAVESYLLQGTSEDIRTEADVRAIMAKQQKVLAVFRRVFLTDATAAEKAEAD